MMRSHIARFWKDRRGSAATFASIAFVALFGMTALAVDTSTYYFQKRRLQGTADLAALAAAASLSTARATAITTVTNNGFDASALETIETGSYTLSSSIAPGNRFVPGGAQSAVRVTLSITAPRYFSRIFSLFVPAAHAQGTERWNTGVRIVDGVTIRARAVAAVVPSAAFAVGSRLVQLDGGILNSVLGGLLGSSLSLSLMDYQALASANVDLFAFSSALATRANLTAATYSDVANANVRIGDVLRAMTDVMSASGGAAAAVTALTKITSVLTSTSSVPVSSLVSFGPPGARPLGPAPLAMTVSALDLVSAAAGIANGRNQVQVSLATGLPGIASATLQLALGERPIGSSFAAVGAAGASVRTAQTRRLVTVSLLGASPFSVISLPIYIEVAYATAQLSAITCSSSGNSVTLGVTPGVVSASVGNVSTADFTNFTTAPDPSAATLVNLLGLVTVTGKANASISSPSATQVTFQAADIAALTKKTVSTTDLTSSLLSSLVGNLQLTPTVIGLGLGLPGNITGTVLGVVSGATPSIDLLLNQVLTALGIGIGQADSWVSGVRCAQPALVN